jgi:hypothetical protein
MRDDAYDFVDGMRGMVYMILERQEVLIASNTWRQCQFFQS